MYYKEICHEDFYEIFILFFMVCAVGMMAQAADKSVNRKMGYFDNTRTVLLFCHRAMIKAAMPHHTLQKRWMRCSVTLITEN